MEEVCTVKTVAIAGTFDSKGAEFSYVKSVIESLGLKTFMIHSGVFEPMFTPEVSNIEVAAAAGVDIREIAARKDRSAGTEALAQGMEKSYRSCMQRANLTPCCHLAALEVLRSSRRA